MGGKIYWNNHKRFGYLCSITLDDEYEIAVEAMSSKWGARIAREDGGRHWDYSNARDLAAAFKRRVKGMKARDKAIEERRREYAEREKAREVCQRAAVEELKRVLGEEIYDACLSVGDRPTEVDGRWVPTATVKLYAGHIRAVDMSVTEAVKLVTVLQCAGYDLIGANK